MTLGNGKVNRQREAILLGAVLATVLALPTVSAALQTSLSTPPNPKALQSAALAAPEFAKTTVRWVLVSIPDRKLALFENGKVIRIYRVAVGNSSTPSPVGEFKIVNRVANPTYYHKGQVIAAGKSNPVGTRWMGLSAKGYGIHGTNQPNSIGKAASTGCIRMSKKDLEELFAIMDVGDAVQIRAERDEQIAAVFDTGTGATTGTQTLAQATTASSPNGGR